MSIRDSAKRHLEQHGYPSTECNHEKELIDVMVEFAEQDNKRLRDALENITYTTLCAEAIFIAKEELERYEV